MTSQFIVLLTEEMDTPRGEIRILGSSADVAHYVEALLEGGFARENIRVFHGSEIQLEVSYRPVVSLASADEEQPEPEEEEAPVAESQNGDVPEGEESEAQGVRNGVRFSELFRPS